jgi:hypothetical protein
MPRLIAPLRISHLYQVARRKRCDHPDSALANAELFAYLRQWKKCTADEIWALFKAIFKKAVLPTPDRAAMTIGRALNPPLFKIKV